MKSFISFLGLTLLVCFNATPHTITHHIVEDGKVWSYKGSRLIASTGYQAEWNEIYSLEGDTVINSRQCLKLYLTCNSPYKSYDHSYLGAMCEEGECVYFIVSDSDKPSLLYDFSCESGNIVKVNHFELVINERKLVKYRGEYLTVIDWSPIEEETFYHNIWIEGIGSPLDLMNDTPIWFDGCPYKELVTCKLNDQIIYDKDEFEASAQYVTEEPHQPLPFLEGNPIWVYKYEHIPMDAVLEDDGWNSIWCWLDTGDRLFTYYFLGDKKEIEGRVYTMMGEVTSNGEEELTVSRWLPVREENGIVYAITDSLPGLIEYDYLEPPYLQQGNESVLYNFSAEIGEKLYPRNNGSTVKTFGTYQLMDGTECRMLKTIDGVFDLYEKLGYLHDQLYYGVMDPPFEIVYPIAADVHVKHLNAFYQNNVMLYKAPDALEGLCVNDTCWTREDAEAYAITYKEDPYHEKVMSFIRQLQGVAEPITFTEGQVATIILPTEPEASKGKYYRLDRVEDGQIVFEQELHPQAHIPYIIVPDEDFSIDLSTLDLAGCYRDTVSVDDVSFIGSFVSEAFDYQDGFYIDIIDTTPDCRFEESCVIGALRAYLLVRWDDPYNQGGTKVPPLEKLEVVLHDNGTGINNINIKDNGYIYDLQGRKIAKPQKGFNIIRYSDGTTRKVLVK